MKRVPHMNAAVTLAMAVFVVHSGTLAQASDLYIELGKRRLAWRGLDVQVDEFEVSDPRRLGVASVARALHGGAEMFVDELL